MKSPARRFGQLVRKLVRESVAHEGRAPGLTLWVSAGGDPRVAAPIPVGAARDVADVRYQAVQAIEQAGAHFAALGRLLVDTTTKHPTSYFGLIVWGRGGEPFAYFAEVEGGKLGRWDEWEPAQLFETFEFVPAALERVAKLEAERTRELEDAGADETVRKVEEALEARTCVAVLPAVLSSVAGPDGLPVELEPERMCGAATTGRPFCVRCETRMGGGAT